MYGTYDIQTISNERKGRRTGKRQDRYMKM